VLLVSEWLLVFLGMLFQTASWGERSLCIFLLYVVLFPFYWYSKKADGELLRLVGCIGSLYVALSKLVSVFVDIESNRHVLYCLIPGSIVAGC
jgi:hypothetical protein